MKRADVLNTLLEAAEQVPTTGRLQIAIRTARKSLRATPENLSVEDYQLLLANTGRALEAIADGMRWAYELKAANPHAPISKIMPIVLEQNRKALQLLQWP